MKRKFFSMLLMGAMAIASVGMFTSCKDYDDDINNLQKQIDANKSDLQTQLSTLQGALTAAQGAAAAAQTTADNAVKAAAAADAAAKAAQGTADAANSAAAAAKAAADAAQATADAAAKQETVAALQSAIEDLKAIIAGKIDQSALDTAIASVEAKIAAIDEKLLTLDDVKKLLDEAGFATQAALNDIQGQIDALNAFKAAMEKVNPIGDAAWKDAVDAAIASLEGVKADIAAKADKTELDAKANQADVNELKENMATAEAAVVALALAVEGVDAQIGAVIDVLNIYVARDLKSLVLRPDVYFGGIEGISVKIYEMPHELPNQKLTCNNVKEDYRYFDRVGDGLFALSHIDKAKYHVNPSNVDLDNFSIDFYNHRASIKEPAATERTTPTRSTSESLKDDGYIYPLYNTTEALKKAGYGVENGILTIPFKAKDANAIESALKAGNGTIASLSMTKKAVGEEVKDTTVNSDYALVVPRYAYGLLIGDTKFKDDDDIFTDEIGKDNGTAWSENLHRNFSFLALAATAPTHEIKYDGKFDITAVLESRVVLNKADWEAIEKKDTTSFHSSKHKATAKWDGEKTENPGDDSDCTIAENLVEILDATKMEELGLKYDIQLVHYALGSNKTGESVHLKLETDADGHVWALPRNVDSEGNTIEPTEENPISPACVGRQPIVCIMVKDADNNIVSFAYMKFLITPEDPVDPKDESIDFSISDIYVNCKDVDGKVTWSQIENLLLHEKLKMSKKTFDKNYVFDYFEETTEKDDTQGATSYKVTRKGIQYDATGKRIAEKDEFGIVAEEWNKSAQDVEDATTHIIKWSFTDKELKALAEKLISSGGLVEKENDYVNKNEIVTYVRYARLAYTPEGEDKDNNDAPKVGEKPKAGTSIWVKLILPKEKLHVAKGDMGANKILTFWYDLNSKTNATGPADAYEVRVNVPVPVPETSASVKTIGYSLENSTAMDIRYDNLLEKANDPIAKRSNKTYTEFTKDLKDFFIDGKLTASVIDDTNFGSIDDMKLGCEFITPSKTVGNAKGFEAEKDGSWTVNGYTGTVYTLKIDAKTRKKIQIVKVGSKAIEPIDLVTLNYDSNAKPEARQYTVLNYVNGEYQDDILNYMTHNELGERETFTAYINITVVNACAPVYWSNKWFNVRFLRPLDLENPKQALVPDAPNDWHSIDLTDALIVKDWREYYGDRQNRTGGKDVSLVLPSVGNQKAFDYAYYQVELDITENVYYTDANLGTSQRSDNFTLGHMPVIESVKDAENKDFILTSQVPNLKLEKTGKTTLRYLNNSGVTGGFHVFIPITMTYVYGFQTVRQTKWVTVGVTPSVEQAMIE